MSFTVSAIILASGSGTRAGLDIPKQFLKIGGRPVLEHTIRTFVRCAQFNDIVVVANPQYMHLAREISARSGDSRVRVVEGDASSRQSSSLIGILACSAQFVLIHDAVRPLVSIDLLRRVIGELSTHDAIDVCVPATDTVVVADGDVISDIPPRARMMLGQTPQAFRRDLVLRAHQAAQDAAVTGATDDCGLVHRLGHPVHIVMGERTNMKITHLDDVYVVERLFQVARLRACETDSEGSVALGDALVIGGTKGLGLSIANAMRHHGATVTTVARATRPGVDVGSRESIREFLDALEGRRFATVVYAPGLLIRKSIADYSDEDWDDTLAVNLRGVSLLLRSIGRLLTPGGHFLALGSSSYSLGRAGYAAYSASKAALINLMQGAADELPQYRLNVVSPQRARTTLRTDAFGAEGQAPMLEPDDVASQILAILRSDISGMNFDIRVDAPLVSVNEG